MFDQNRNQMDPQDTKRLFIFFALAILIYFTYNHFILEPQSKALREAARIEALEQQKEAALAALEPEEIKTREDIISESRRIKIENGAIFGSIALTGGRIDDIGLHEYYETLERTENVSVLSPKNTEFPRYIDHGWITEDKNVRVPDQDTKWSAPADAVLSKDNPVTLKWDNGQGLVFERKISIDDNYMFTIEQKVTNNSGKKVTLYPYGLISQTGVPKGIQGSWILHEGPIGYVGDSLSEITYADLRKGKGAKKLEADRGWIGITDKYWLTSLIPPQGENVTYGFNYSGVQNDKNNRGKYQVDFVGSAVSLEPGQSTQAQSRVFTGAKKVLLLNQYRDTLDIPHFDLAVNFGWFWFLAKPFFYALHFMGELFGNIGLAIIALTILIRGSVFPLTNASYRSFAKMKKVAPQVATLRESYGEDKQKLQMELMKLYQAEGVNPMAGCFPILLQIPIFFALYKVLFVTIEIRHAPFFGWIQDLSAPDPTSIFNLFGLIDWTPPSFLMIGVWPCLMLVGMLIQKRLNPPPQDPLQRDMANYFPFIITYMMAGFASGLVIYWTFSAFIGLIQQIIIMRSLNVPIYLFGQSDDEKRIEDTIGKTAEVHPLIEMAEHKAEEALFGDTPTPPVTPPKPKKKKKKK